MKHRHSPSLALFTLGFLCAGLGSCLMPRGTAQNTYTSTHQDARLEEQVGDPGLARDLAMESLRTRREDGRLQVTFDLRNKRASDLKFEWSIQWLDDQGFPVDGSHAWTTAYLRGKGTTTVSRTATSPKASGFRLNVSRPDTVH